MDIVLFRILYQKKNQGKHSQQKEQRCDKRKDKCHLILNLAIIVYSEIR